MRIGIDCRKLLGRYEHGTGVARYVTQIVKGIIISCEADADNDIIIVAFVDHSVSPDVQEFLENSPVVEVHTFTGSRWKQWLPFVYSHIMMAWSLNAADLDVYFSPADWLPLRYSGKSIITVHDLAIYDHPEWFSTGQSFSTDTVVPHALHSASHIIAVSEATKEQVMRIGERSEETISVIYEAAHEPEYITEKEEVLLLDELGVQKPFILVLGRIEERKNSARIAEAFQTVVEHYPEEVEGMQLIYAGPSEQAKDILIPVIKERNTDRITILGAITEQDKAALLQNAFMFVFPSLWEGFGLPILEAQQVGVPVISSHNGALAEVVASSGIVVDPENTDTIMEAMRSMILNEDMRQQYIDKGAKNVRRFSWEIAAQKTLALLTEVGQDTSINK